MKWSWLENFSVFPKFSDSVVIVSKSKCRVKNHGSTEFPKRGKLDNARTELLKAFHECVGSAVAGRNVAESTFSTSRR